MIQIRRQVLEDRSYDFAIINKESTSEFGFKKKSVTRSGLIKIRICDK